MPGNGPGLQAIRCTVPAVTVRRAATTAMALASTGWPRPRAHADHSFGCGTADRADRPSLATDRRVFARARLNRGSACVRGSQTMPMSFGWIWGQEV